MPRCVGSILACAVFTTTSALVAPLTADLDGLQSLAEKAEKSEGGSPGEDDKYYISYYPDEFQYTSHMCASIDDPQNKACAEDVKWAFSNKDNKTVEEMWAEMKKYTESDHHQASFDDFHKLYFCAPPAGKKKQCGTPPCMCTHPPCHHCLYPERPRGCTKNSTDMRCKPPAKALDYNGWHWPDIKVGGKGPHHIFAIGDWGGMDTTLPPIEGRDPLLPWTGNGLPKPGPTPFPRTRWNKNHDFLMCNHAQFIECYKTWGWACAPGCGYDKHVDTQPQQLVAKTLKDRASKMYPAAILNVGDNFYWGGIEKTCGTPMDELSFTAKHQFDQIFEGQYMGVGLDGVPWISCLGNHDYGGRRFNNGWDQQLAYTWKSNRWILPAAYYSVHLYFQEEKFGVDVFVLDSNAEDGKDTWQEPNHNICGETFNPWGATCASAGGPPSVQECHQWFWNMWGWQTGWLAEHLQKSKAAWQIAVTHFPCGTQKNFWMDMHNRLGLDLLVTGHRHSQEFWGPERLGGLTCFVTGGGGGISSEATPNIYWKKDWYGEAQYGFYDLTVTQANIQITSIDWSGYELLHATVWPKPCSQPIS